MRDLVPSLGFEPRLITLGVLATEPPGKPPHILKNFLTSNACLYPVPLPSGCVHVAVIPTRGNEYTPLPAFPKERSLNKPQALGPWSQARLLGDVTQDTQVLREKC